VRRGGHGTTMILPRHRRRTSAVINSDHECSFPPVTGHRLNEAPHVPDKLVELAGREQISLIPRLMCPIVSLSVGHVQRAWLDGPHHVSRGVSYKSIQKDAGPDGPSVLDHFRECR